MSAADAALRRAHVFVQEARDRTLNDEGRVGALDSARIALLEARKNPSVIQPVRTVLVSICDIGINDENPIARAFVANVIEDFCLRDVKTFIVTCMHYLFKTLRDHHVLVIKRGIRVLTTLFRKVLGYVVSVGVGSGPNVFPEYGLRDWLDVQRKVVDLMDSPDAGIQNAATKFSETVVLALSYSEGRPSHEHFTLNYAALRDLKHPLLAVPQLEKEGKRCVSMVSGVIYAALGITPPQIQGGEPPYVPKSRITAISLMTALSVLGNLVKRRENILPLTVPPLILSVLAITGSQGPRSPVFLRLPDGQRRSIILTLRLTMLAARAYPHTRNNTNICTAANDIQQYEHMILQERNRLLKQQRANAASRKQRPRGSSAPDPPLSQVPSSTNHAVKRPRAPPPPKEMQIVPATDAFHFAQFYIQTMHPHELAHFITTRLLLSTPEDPNRLDTSTNSTSTARPVTSGDPRRQKRARVAQEDSNVDARRMVSTRRNAPPVIPLVLSKEGLLRLLHRCCTSMLEREETMFTSGAGPLRNLVLAKQLAQICFDDTEMSRQLCDAACAFIADKISSRRELALAWLHAVLCADKMGRTEEEVEQAIENLLLLSKQRFEAVAGKNAHLLCITQTGSGKLVKSENVLSKSEPIAGGEGHGFHSLDTEMGTVDTERATTESEACEAEVELVSDDENETAARKCPIYEKLLHSILEKLQARDAPDDTEFIRMIVDAPLIPPSVIEMLHEACRDISKNETGLKALRDIVAERCGVDRKLALDILLELAVDSDEVIRGPCIRLVADKLFMDMQGDVPSRIVKFAIGGLHSSIGKANNEEGSTTDLERFSWLFSTLVAQKHELLHDMAQCYTQANKSGRAVLLKHGQLLGGQLGTESEPVIKLIRGTPPKEGHPDKGAPDGVEDLALTVLKGIIKKYGRPSRATVDAACDRFKSSRDARFLEAVLSGLNHESLIAFLGDLVELAYSAPKAERNEQTDMQETSAPPPLSSSTKVFKQMIRTIMEAQPASLSAAELLIELHSLEASPAVSNAIQACFELKVIFKQGVVAQALQQMIGQTPIPSLLMNSVLLTKQHHNDRERYLNETILLPLISKKVWSNETLWAGFLRYCTEVKEPGKILLRLPAAQLDQSFLRKPALAEVFRAHVKNPRFTKAVTAKHLKVIKAALLRTNPS